MCIEPDDNPLVGAAPRISVFDVFPLNQGWGGIQTPRPFPEPIPFRGAQLLFEVPDEVIRGAVHFHSLFIASVDVTEADWSNCAARGGRADLRTQGYYSHGME